MKKLFKTGSSILIEENTAVRITGPYDLLAIGPDFARIQIGDRLVEVRGEDLVIDALYEQASLFQFESITTFTMKKIDDKE